MIDETLANEALELVAGDRGDAYGPPHEDFAALGRAWGSLLTRALGQPIPDLPPRLVAGMLVSLKLNRDAFHPKRDNLVDGIGYLLCASSEPQP